MSNNNDSIETTSNTEMQCEVCGTYLGEGNRWVLSEEVQKTDWSNPDLPGIDILHATIQGNFCCEEHAMMAGEAYLAHFGSALTWPDILPVERCGICGEEFKAYEFHQVITLNVEHGPINEPVTIEAESLARFCPSCVQFKSLSEFLGSEANFYFCPDTTVNCKDGSAISGASDYL